MRVSKFFGWGLLTASAALLGSQAAQAQYSQYGGSQYGGSQPAASQYAGGQYSAGPYAVQPQAQPQPQQYQPQQYQPQQPGYAVPQGPAPRVAMNFQEAPNPEALPSPGTEGNYNPTPAYAAPAPTPAAQPYPQQSYPQQNYAGGGCPTGNCNTGASAYGGSPYGAYDCGNTGYNTFGCGYGSAAGGVHSKLCGLCGCNLRGVSGYGCCGPRPCAWFGGVYGLLMQRANNGCGIPLVFHGASAMPVGSYPTSDRTILTSNSGNPNYQGGFEARVGRWFGNNQCGGCGGCAPPLCGIEGVYWGIFEDDGYAMVTPTTGMPRLYSMIDMRGLQYDAGSGYRPMRDYFDYGPPVQADVGDPIRVTAARVRNTFNMNNVEVNFLRLSMFGGGYSVGAGAGAYGGGVGAGYGGLGSGRLAAGQAGGCDACDGGCDGGACGGSCYPKLSCTSVCGFRYINVNEQFMYGVDYENQTTNATGTMAYNSEVQNNLYGFQLGSRGLYRLGCAGRWGLNFAGNFGIFGNDAQATQYFDTPTGNIQYFNNPGGGVASSDYARVNANKTVVSFAGELRAGLSYQCTCNCRIYGGWRVLAISNIATATNQIPGAFMNANQYCVNTNGSLIVHGLQTGVIYNY